MSEVMPDSTGDRLIRVEKSDHTVPIEAYQKDWKLLGWRRREELFDLRPS